MRQDSHHLRLLALLYERVVQHYALVLEKAIPACADLDSSYQHCITLSTVVQRPSNVTTCTGVGPARCCQSYFDCKRWRGLISRRPFLAGRECPGDTHMYALLCAERVEPSMTNNLVSGNLRDPANSSIFSLRMDTLYGTTHPPHMAATHPCIFHHPAASDLRAGIKQIGDLNVT